MKYKLNLCFGLSSIALGVFDCIRAIDGKVITSEPYLILGIILIAVGMGNLGVFIGGNSNGVPRP